MLAQCKKSNLKNKKNMTTVIIIGIVCGVLWIYLKTKEDWDNMTKPPKGWLQHKGWRQKLNKP